MCVLLEQGKLTSGSTWHAAGLVGQLRSSASITQVLKRSVELYKTLEAETGLATGWKMTGCLRLATTDDRWTEYKRLATTARTFGMEMELISPDEVKRMWPLLETSDLIGASWLPTDGQASPSDITQSLAKRRAHARRHHPRRRPRHRLRDGWRPHHRRPHQRRHRRLRHRRSTAAASGPARSAPWRASMCRCSRSSTSTSSPKSSTASAPTPPPSATPTAAPISRKRSAASSWAATSPTPSPGPPATSPTPSSSSSSTTTGTISSSI